MSLVFDEYGRPFIILREQQAANRLKGLEAQKVRRSRESCRGVLMCGEGMRACCQPSLFFMTMLRRERLWAACLASACVHAQPCPRSVVFLSPVRHCSLAGG